MKPSALLILTAIVVALGAPAFARSHHATAKSQRLRSLTHLSRCREMRPFKHAIPKQRSGATAITKSRR